MQDVLPTPPRGIDEQDSRPGFQVLIVYEDVDSGVRAKQAYDFLEEHLSCDFEFSVKVWKFSVLSIGKLRNSAAQDATGADLIMISSCGRILPGYVKTWIEAVLPVARNVHVLVALFICEWADPVQTRETRDYLVQAARRAHIGFFT